MAADNNKVIVSNNIQNNPQIKTNDNIQNNNIRTYGPYDD